MHIATQDDLEHVAEVLGHPDVWPFIRDDGCPLSAHELAYEVINSPAVYVLMPNEYTVFVVAPVNAVMYDIHTAILPGGRHGKKSSAVGMEMVQWMFDNTPCQKVVTWVPSYHIAALKLGLKCGLTEEGYIKKSFKKNGVLYDQHLLGKEK